MNIVHVSENDLNSLRDVDIVAGFVTGAETERIEQFCAQLTTGMRTFFPQFSWKLVHAVPNFAGVSASGQTPEVANLISIPVRKFGVHQVTFPAHGVPAKTNGLRAILHYGQRVRAKVILLLDSAQRGFDCTWVDALIRPSLHSKYDLVASVHSGSARERLLSANLISPMFRALFGVRLTEPAAGQLAISARLANQLLKRHDWDSPAARFAPELWMSFIASAERFRLAETVLGRSSRQMTGARLGFQSSLAQTIDALFALMEQYEDVWTAPVRSIDFDQFGKSSMTIQQANIPDGIEQTASFTRAFGALRESWQQILNPRTFVELVAFRQSLESCDPNPEFANALWVRVVYEFAAAWKHRVLPRSHLVGLFTPLYRARAGSFLLKTRWKELSEVDAETARVSMYFEAIKPVLDRLWCADPSSRLCGPEQQPLVLEAACLKS